MAVRTKRKSKLSMSRKLPDMKAFNDFKVIRFHGLAKYTFEHSLDAYY
jgi:hypothetical protein